MAVPAFASLRRYIGKLLTNTDWDFNFQTVTNWLADGTTDLNVNNVTGKAISGTTGAFSSTVTATSFVGSGVGLTGISSTVGQISMYGGTTDPANWFICDGREINRTTYATLFAVLGVKYGQGDNSTTFNVPDLRSYMARGASWGSKTFAPADVDTTADTIAIASHSLNKNGRAVRFTTATTLPAGLSAGTTYFVRVKTSGTFEVYDTRAHAIDTTGTTGRIDLTSQGTGTHTILDYEDVDWGTRTASSTGGSTTSTPGSLEEGTVCTSASTTEARAVNISVNFIIRYQ
jgi:microcystin-dependent protein